MSERTVDPADPAIIEYYTGEACHVLAIALHRRTGWPMVAFVGTDERESIAHVAVQPPSRPEAIFDVLGFRAAETVMAGYHDVPGIRTVEVIEGDLYDWVETDRLWDFDPDGETEAFALADALLVAVPPSERG